MKDISTDFADIENIIQHSSSQYIQQSRCNIHTSWNIIETPWKHYLSTWTQAEIENVNSLDHSNTLVIEFEFVV